MSSTVTSIGSSSNNGSLSSGLALTGLASGMDWSTVIQELAQAERGPEIQWQSEQATIGNQNSAFSTIKSDLTTLQNDIKSLQDTTLYDSRSTTTSDSTIASASAASSATLGSFSFKISQLATAAKITGSGNISQPLSPDGNLNNVTIGTAGFSSQITAGTFTVDGAQVTIATTDTLQTVFNNIASATNNKVTASYDSGTDEITLTSSDNSEIVLGSAADTSNFLQVAQLYNGNNTGTISSASALGRATLTAALSSSDLSTPISDGGSGAGAFKINGVTINFNASTDSLQDVLDRINNSAAGVTASYDTLNNRFLLQNKSTGDVGISLQDVTGNFLTATGLSGGTLTRGQNLLYTLNDSSQQLVSQSNTISSTSSGITGLSVNVANTGTVTVNVASDTSKISSTIQQFVTDYNTVQNYISGQMAVTTASDGTVKPGTLTGDQTANDIVSSLRSLSYSVLSGTNISSSINQLASLGIQTNGKDNTLSLSDSGALTSALQNNLNAVKSFFTDTTNGWSQQLNTYLDNTIGDSGTLTSHQTNLTQQSNNISTQISNLENTIADNTKQWQAEFQAMEQAQAQVNQEMQYLSQQISNGAL